MKTIIKALLYLMSLHIKTEPKDNQDFDTKEIIKDLEEMLETE